MTQASTLPAFTLGCEVRRLVALLTVLMALLCGTGGRLTPDHEPGCLSTWGGQTELTELLVREYSNGTVLFPVGASGIIHGDLWEPLSPPPLEDPEMWMARMTRPDQQQPQRHRHRHRHGRRVHPRRRTVRSATPCAADRVCTAVMSLDEDPDRVPRLLRVATCPDCSQCSALPGGYSCRPVMYQMTVFRRCTATRACANCLACQSAVEQIPVGCQCVRDA